MKFGTNCNTVCMKKIQYTYRTVTYNSIMTIWDRV